MIVRAFQIKSGCIVLAAISLMLVSGCGGDGFGSELAARPRPQALDQGDGATLRLPQDRPFSITLAPKHAAPGLVGTADVDTHVSKDGSADASANVENGGNATASFQLGHALKNDSDRLVNLHVRLRCEYETDAQATPPGPLPDAKVSLNLYARDGRNRLLRSLNLAQHSTEEGAAATKDRSDVDLTFPLGARESVSIYLAGGVEIETSEGHAARGSVKLNKLEMEITAKTAPPVQKAANEQG